MEAAETGISKNSVKRVLHGIHFPDMDGYLKAHLWGYIILYIVKLLLCNCKYQSLKLINVSNVYHLKFQIFSWCLILAFYSTKSLAMSFEIEFY